MINLVWVFIWPILCCKYVKCFDLNLTIRASLAPCPAGDTFLLIGPKGPPLAPRPSGVTLFTNRPVGEADYHSDVHTGCVRRYLEQQHGDHHHSDGYQRGAHRRSDKLPKVAGKPHQSQDTLSSFNISYCNTHIAEVVPIIPSRSASVPCGQTLYEWANLPFNTIFRPFWGLFNASVTHIAYIPKNKIKKRSFERSGQLTISFVCSKSH